MSHATSTEKAATGKLLGLAVSLLSFMAVAMLGLAWLGLRIGARYGHRKAGALVGALAGFLLGLNELRQMIRAIQKQEARKGPSSPGP